MLPSGSQTRTLTAATLRSRNNQQSLQSTQKSSLKFENRLLLCCMNHKDSILYLENSSSVTKLTVTGTGLNLRHVRNPDSPAASLSLNGSSQVAGVATVPCHEVQCVSAREVSRRGRPGDRPRTSAVLCLPPLSPYPPLPLPLEIIPSQRTVRSRNHFINVELSAWRPQRGRDRPTGIRATGMTESRNSRPSGMQPAKLDASCNQRVSTIYIRCGCNAAPDVQHP